MSEPAVVFGDGKAVAGAHQGSRAESPSEPRLFVAGAAPGCVVPAVTNTGAPAPVRVTSVRMLPAQRWEEGSSGGRKEGSSLHLLSLLGWGAMLCHQGVTPAWLCL